MLDVFSTLRTIRFSFVVFAGVGLAKCLGGGSRSSRMRRRCARSTRAPKPPKEFEVDDKDKLGRPEDDDADEEEPEEEMAAPESAVAVPEIFTHEYPQQETLDITSWQAYK